MSNNITTGEVRFSYVYVFTPRVSQDGSESKYSCTLLIPKTDNRTMQMIYAAIEQAKQEGLQGVFKGAVPPNLAIPLYDGDGVRPNSGEAFGPECRGHFVITASNKMQPSVVDVNVQPILNQADLYSGCYGRASIRFFSYNSNGRKGIGCSLNAIQKTRDGDALGSYITPDEAFGGSNAFQPTQPMYGQPTAPVPQQPSYGQAAQPGYNQQAQPNYGQATQPMYGQPTAPVPQQPSYGQTAINPITGQPYGGVMGL